MKLKQFIFALVAMLSFSFSGFAQTTVSSQTELETALQNGGEVTLGASITVSAPVTIPSGSEVVLNLNGKTLKATKASTKVLENQGKLTINGQGTVSGVIYNGTGKNSTAEMTLNGGTYSLDGNSGGLHHYGKTLTINDGVVVKTTSYGVRMAGEKSVLNLNGGTYTSTGTGDMARPLALSNGTVNFLDSDITVNGYMHVMVGQVTVNFGENNQYSPFEAYHQGNSYASSVFYCKTLAEAISRTGFAPVTLVKNVKVAADAPITVNKAINLNLNGKNLSATNAKTTVLKNYANLTINGKGTVTGLVYNGDTDNKGVAEMTLNGGTYKLDGVNGGIFNYGKTLTVNDGVTISSQVYGLRMSNAASVINLNGGTFTSTNPTDNMKRAIAVDAGTINFNDDDITINGYLHASRTKAIVNFGEYCQFDAFMYSTTNASGYYVVNLENAIDKADAGFEIVLQKNLERSEIVTLPKKVTLDGNGKTLTSTAGRAINVDCADVVTIENLTIAGATGCERGINIINKAGTTNLKKVNVSGVSYYAVHVATSAGAAKVNIENSNLTGWAAVAAYGENGTINVKNSNLVGIGNATDNTSNDFATIAAASNITVNVTGGKVTAERKEGKAPQAIVCGNSTPTTGVKFVLDTELELINAEYINHDLGLDNNTVTVRKEYGTNYVTTPADNGLVTLTGASEAMIGDVKYSTIAQAFAAAKEGETITLIADVTPSLTSQRAITKAAVIDLGGKTLTLKEDDLYFGTTTFKNGTIVVDPSVKPSTAVFWMFKDQVLTFEGVKLVATGVTGTYLIGLDGDNADLNLFSSEIIVDNETALDLDIICVNASTGNDIWMEDSKVTVKNLDGRVFFRGNYTVAGESEINLEGITKAGFRIEAGQTLTIKDKAVVNVTGEPRDGGIHLTDPSANYTKAETATVNATINQPQVAKVGETIYKSLIAAVEAVEDGGTITLVANETFTKTNYSDNGGWRDGVAYSGDKSFTIDLNGFTVSQDGSLNDYLFWFKNAGSKENTITIKNGTLDAGTTAFCALCTANSHDNELTVNTENVNLINNISNGSTVKIRAGSVYNAKAGTKITGKNSYLGIENWNATVNIYDGAEIYMNGTSSYNGCLVGVGGNGTVNVYGGYGKGVSGGLIAMTSGGTINVEGGEWIANTDGTFANSNKSVLIAQSDKQYNAGAGNAVVNVTGGTFKGGYNCYGNKAGDAQINISGGNFNANPTTYVEDDYIAVENNGVWNVVRAAAKIGDTKYATLESAFKAATSGCTIEIVSDVTVDYAWDARYTGGKFTVPVTINGNGKTIKFTNTVYDGGNYLSAFRFEADATVNNLVVDMSEAQSGFAGRFRAISAKGNLTVENCTFIGNGSENNTRAIIFGEGAGTNSENLVISIKNNKFIGWKRGITDNENAQDVKSVTISGNTLENAAVYVSAKENVVFNNNTTDADVIITSYNNREIVAVEAIGNTLNAEKKNSINVNPANVNAQEDFLLPSVAMVGETPYASLEAAAGAAQNGDVIILNENVTLAESLTLPAGITFNGNGKQINGAITAGGDLTFAGHTKVTNFSAGYYNRVITIGEGACLEVTGGRMTVSYGNIFNITGSITNAKEADKANAQPSLIVEPGLSFNGDGRGVQFNVTNAYVKLGDSSSKNSGATGEFNFNFNNSIVEFTKTLKTYEPTKTGLDPEFKFNAVNSVVTFASHLELWRTKNNFVLNNTDLTVGGSFANAGGITVENGSNFVVNAPIMSSHGGNTGTINVLGGTFELKDSNQDWENAGTMKVAVNGKVITNDFKCVGEGQIVVDATDIPDNTDVTVVDGNGAYNFKDVTTVEGSVVATSFENGDVVIFKTYAKIGDTYYKSFQAAINAVKAGETIEMVDDCSEVVSINKSNVAFTIDGADKTYTGKIEINVGQNVTVENLNFVHEADDEFDFIANVGSPTGKNYNTTLLVDGCSFTGNSKGNVVAVRTIHPTLVTIKNSTGAGLHSMLQNTGGQAVTVDGVTVAESKGGLAIGSPNGQVTVKNSNLTTATYGVRLDANNTNAPGAILENNKINAYIPVSVRKATANYNLTFNGNESEYTATNNDGKWCAICTTEYEEGVALNQPTGKVKVVVNAALPQSGLYGNHVEGSLTAAYTGADGYWGECGGNANYSFELKFFNGETFMGSTSLNDVDNIINGDVNVTWNIKFDAESNTDSYWTMSWDVAPSVAMQPNRVEQWVDGVKVAECAIQLNGPDNINPIATAVVDADGNLVKCYPTLEAAVAAGNNVAILKAGTYKVPAGKDLTITGAVEGVKFAKIGAHNMGGASMTFNNVTFEYGNENYKGLQHSGDLVYNNCTINGQVFLYGQKETFNKCIFNQTSADAYNVWTYGAKEVTFNECTFNSAGKSVLIYAESASVFNKVTVTDCTFEASQAVDGKAAIELDSSLTAGANLTITNSTTNGFGTGNVSGNSLWNNKKGNANAANNDITIVVDGISVLAPVYDAKIGDVQYRSLQEAIDAVQEGETITMLADVEFVDVASAADKTTSINVPAGKKFTLDLNGKTIYGENSSNSSFAFMTICSGADVTIDDTSAEKTGKIAYTSTRETPNENHEGYTIRNKGNLTLNGGTVANSTPLASNGYEMAVTTAIDNCSSSGAVSTFTMNGGVVVSNTYFAIRSSVYANNTNGATSAIVALNGGTVHGLHFCDWGSKNLDYQVAIAAGAVVEHGNYPGLTEQAVRLAIGTAATSKVAIDIAEGAQINGTIHGAAAKIGTLYYTKLQKAIDAVQNGETITLIADNKENVTVVQAPDMAFTIDGNFKTMKGTITVNGKSAAYATAGLTIKNMNFNADGIATEACINLGVKGDNNTRYTNGVTVDNCTFTGTNKDKVGIKNYTGGCKNVTITKSTATGMHSLAQFKTSYGVTLTKNTVTECKNGISVDGSTGVTVTECTVDVAGYGIRANGGSDVTVTSNNVKAFTPVVVRSVTDNSSFTFNGENTMVAADETGKWMVIGDEEYEAGKTLPAESTANVVVALNDANLSYTGIHGAGLAGKGTEDEPYLINNATELQMFRDKVNAGATKFNAAGVWVALNADIDLAGINWVGIGSMTAAHGFMGNFDGKNFKIKNLTINNPAVDTDGYAYAGLFALTEGTDKDNQNVVKNLTIENVTINTTGHIVAAAIAYAYYTNVDNVMVCGNIAITGGDYTAGVLAYTRRCVNASNLSIIGENNSFVKGAQVVGGVISDIQMNGGLKAEYSNFSAKNIAVIGDQMVGGISGNIATQTLNGATVENVALTSGDARVGTVAGCFGGTSTITDVTVNNVTGATAVIGATYNGAKAVEARIVDTYYETFAAAYAVAQAGETVTMLADLTMSEILVLDKAITLDGNDKTLTSTAARAINVSGADGVTIQNLTINATGERAINVIQGATNVTIDNVKATAANYTVNLAGSAANAVVAINKSELTGLNIVNVAAPGAQVTVNETVLNCADHNDSEKYAALALNKDAKNGSIAATNVTFNIDGDSRKATNQAEGGTVTIDGSTEYVEQHVAYISYGNNWYGFATLEAAIAKAKAGETVTLLRDVTVAQPVAINKAITLDGNNKTLTYTGSNRAITVENIADADIDVTIKNLTINNTASSTERGINYNENGTLTLENVTVKGEHTTYAINLPGMSQNAKVVIKDSKFTGLIALNIWGANTQVTAENSEFYSVDHSTAEGYAAIKLNNNGEIAADNSTVEINGGKVIAKDENGDASIAVEDCTNGSTVTISDKTEVVGSTTKSVAIISYGSQFYTYSTIEEAIAEAEAGKTIELISDVTINYGARKLLATAAADKAVTIDGKGHTLTLNSTDSDWSSIGLENNNKLVLKNMTVNKAGKGATSGAWNTHAIIFSTAVEMENVKVNNSVAVAADAAFTNVVFNEANGYYSLWIEANGQTVTVKGGSMTATSGGRGIKIADEYISAPAQVKLSVDGTEFSTAKKAAVLVSSTAGAQITASNYNIDNVVEDKVNFVWVDEDWATYFGNVQVTGATVAQEGIESFVAAVTVNGAVKAYYATIAKAIEAAQAGEEVTILAGEYTGGLTVNKAITVKGEVDAEGNNLVEFTGKLSIRANGATVMNLNFTNNSGTAAYVGAKDVTIDGCSLVGSNGLYQSYTSGLVTFKNSYIKGGTYGIHFDGNAGGKIVIENCTVIGWTSFAGTIENVAISGTTFAKGNQNKLRFYQNATITDCTFNEKMSIDFGKNETEAAFINCSVENGKALTDVIYIADIAEMGIEVTIDNVPVSVAVKVDGKYYLTLQAAIDAATEGQTVTIVSDIALTEGVTVAADDEIFIDLNGKTVSMETAEAAVAALIKNNGTLTIESSVDGGKLSFLATAPSAANAYASNTISNYGTLTINGGTVENLSTGGACYALDNYAGSTATINGGKLTAEKTAVRIFNWTNGEDNAAELNVEGGEIISNDGYGININAGNAPYVALNISGGTITTNDTDYNLAVYVVNKNSAENFTADISGGTFNGNFALNGVTSTTMVRDNVTVTGGTFDGVICYGEPACQFIAGGSYKAEFTEDYLVYGYQLEANAETGLYDANCTGERKEVTFIDGEFTEYTNNMKIKVGTLTYKRTISAAWQAFYVPFQVPVDSLAKLGFEVAYINGVRRSDYNEDGEFDSGFSMELIMIHGGKGNADGSGKTLKANYPYFIRPVGTQKKDLTIVLNDAWLYAANDVTYDCSTFTEKFEITGNSSQVVVNSTDNEFRYVVSSKGEWSQRTTPGNVKPFRFYMTVTSRDGSSPLVAEQPSMSIVVRGEELPDGTTVIYDVYDENTEDMIFDLQGRRVLETEKGGIYIKGGKKFIAQ